MSNILFINSIQKQCGCNSYGVRTFNIIIKSKKYRFYYYAPTNETEFLLCIEKYNPAAVIYNYHPLTMDWFKGCTNSNIKHFIIWHEGTEHINLTPDYWLYVDSLLPDIDNKFSLPRPLIENGLFENQKNEIPIISSFGMAFGNKGFGRVVKIVNQQFDEAIIRLHLPRAYYGDREGEATVGVLPGCQAEMKKEGIKLEFSHDFLTDNGLLQFLSESDLNIFLYDEMKGRGLSSVIDYALGVDVPIGINDSDMFRHIQKPEINVANKTLKEIIEQGTEPLKEFKQLWSNENLIKKYEYILDTTL